MCLTATRVSPFTKKSVSRLTKAVRFPYETKKVNNLFRS